MTYDKQPRGVDAGELAGGAESGGDRLDPTGKCVLLAKRGSVLDGGLLGEGEARFLDEDEAGAAGEVAEEGGVG